MSGRDEAGLPEAAEAMLQDWPAPQREEKHWEEAAGRVAGKLEDATRQPTSDELLAPPLPAGPDEGSLDELGPAADEAKTEKHTKAEPKKVSRPPPPGDSGPSLAEMARARVKGAGSSEDAAAIARDSLSHLKEERHTGAMAGTVAAAATARDEDEDDKVTDLDQARAKREAAAKKAVESRTGQMAAVALVAVGLAAAAVLIIRSRSEAPQQPVALAPAAPLASGAAAEPAPVGEPRSREEGALRPGDLPPLAEQSGASAKQAPGQGKARLAPEKGADSVEPEEVDLEEPAKSEADKKRLASKAEESDRDEEMEEALNRPIPLQPTMGEISSALGTVLGSAQRCVIGHDRPSTATVTFGSHGRVKSVSVSGPAAGTAAEGCIRKALSRMRLPRFAKPTFTVRGIKIRP